MKHNVSYNWVKIQVLTGEQCKHNMRYLFKHSAINEICFFTQSSTNLADLWLGLTDAVLRQESLKEGFKILDF